VKTDNNFYKAFSGEKKTNEKNQVKKVYCNVIQTNSEKISF
jgi:hypothetical protein